MARWDNPGIPHKGWTLIGYEDIREDALDDEDFDYETCEMQSQYTGVFLNAPSQRRLCTFLAERMHHQRGQLAPSRPAYSPNYGSLFDFNVTI